ncbi:MAG: hypothetical protein JKP98_03840 [Rhodobacteraceae bacterium]|nr:hypothetical protein [Paracoccaceae bacterium]
MISVLNAEGARAINKHYRPYGQVSQWVTGPAAAAEDQGFTGQRHDAGRGSSTSTPATWTPNSAASSSPTGSTPTSPGWGRTAMPTASTTR